MTSRPQRSTKGQKRKCKFCDCGEPEVPRRVARMTNEPYRTSNRQPGPSGIGNKKTRTPPTAATFRYRSFELKQSYVCLTDFVLNPLICNGREGTANPDFVPSTGQPNAATIEESLVNKATSLIPEDREAPPKPGLLTKGREGTAPPDFVRSSLTTGQPSTATSEEPLVNKAASLTPEDREAPPKPGLLPKGREGTAPPDSVSSSTTGRPSANRVSCNII